MATPQLSPGVLVREVDLTVGRADNVLDNIGAIAAPFAVGPVDEAIDITTENELINVFGKPKNEDNQYEYWMSASSFLSYGGVLKVVRTDGTNLVNANSALSGVSTDVGIGSTGLKIKNFDDYELNVAPSDSVSFTFAAKNPGSWANNLKVAMIDDKADQIITVGIATTLASVGYAVLTQLVDEPSVGVGTTSLFNGYLKGIITGIGQSTIDVKITSLIDSAENETEIQYAQRSQLKSFRPSNSVSILDNGGTSVATATLPSTGVLDWYDQQTISLTNTTIFWKSIAPKPSTNQYVLERNGKNDAMHVVVIDDTGSITGIQGNLLEKHVNLSKAFDTVSAVNSPQKIFYKNYIGQFSNYIYAGDNISDGVTETVYASGFSSGYVGFTTAEGLWNQNAQSVTFSSVGNLSYTLRGGKDYSGTNNVGGMNAQLGDLMTSYRLFSNKDEIAVDYLIMGPGLGGKLDSQAKAQELISIAEQRKDCLAVISPFKNDVVDITNTDTQTDNIIEFFSSLSSSSYAIFDSGYKYTYDRFNNRFRYIPCNPDIAGLMVRTGIDAYPWFSPAGQQRGVLNNAIKLAYNPSKAQRDQLYSARVNAIVNQPGIGILLFGDKTALGYSSAFDRINVRRLFLTVEQALERAAQAQLFELNTQTTRANFINIVEPYLRDVQSKDGVYDFLVICDQTNNTPDVIDNNEFRADIFLKPTRSINYVTLTFVATRTGVSFEEVAGRV
jgi:phage tail sheath protein FI